MHKQHIHPSMFNNQDLILILFQAHEISKLCHALWHNVLMHTPLCLYVMHKALNKLQCEPVCIR